MAKRLGLLHELVPKAVRLGVLVNPANGLTAEATLIEETLLTSGQVIHCEEISKGLHQFRSFAAFVKLAVLTWNAENTWNAEDKVIDRTMTGNGIDYDHAYQVGLAKALALNRDKLKERERILDDPVMGLIYYPNLEPPCSALNSPATSVASQGGR